MAIIFRTWLLVTLFLTPCLAFAEEPYLQFLIDQTRTRKLALDREWLALGYYKKQNSHWKSETPDENFFFADDGENNPVSELEATLTAFFNSDIELGNEHPQCRFPARLSWAIENLAIDPTLMPAVKCEAYLNWRNNIKAAGVSIVLPAAYLNNPSSMFGHTFLRIDQEHQSEQTRLLAYSIGYVADVAPGSNPVAYIYRGLFGGYPGTYTGAPYYDKVIEYGDIEARDIWEYKLDLNEQEVDRLVSHVWELQRIKFDYYFFDENCSYRLLTLLEIAKPGLNLTEHFGLYAIPADTVREVKRHNLIKSKRFRPAVVTRILNKMAALDQTQQKLAYQLAIGRESPDSEFVTSQSSDAQAGIIDLAYEYSRYRAQKLVDERKSIAPISLALLQARARMAVEANSDAITSIPVSPDEGHSTARFDFGIGRFDEIDYQSVRLRPAYHDLLDSDQGYTEGAQINFLDTELRHYDIPPRGQREWDVERLELVAIKSLALRNSFFKPYSWEINVGWQRRYERAQNTARFVLDGSWGVTYGVRDRLLVYGLAGIGVHAKSNLIDDQEWALQAKFGFIWRLYGNAKLRIEVVSEEYDGPNTSDGKNYLFHYNQPVTQNTAVRFEFDRYSYSEVEYDQTRIAWRWYF